MRKILVVYDSGYGATASAAQVIAEALAANGPEVDIGPAGRQELAGYDAVAVGSPIRLGRCTPRIKRFLKDNQARLAVSQTAFFFTCMSATAGEADQDQTLYVDPRFDAPDRPRPRLRAMERNHTARYYLDHFRKLIPGIRPVAVAFFKGRLSTAELKPLHWLIMRVAMFSLPEIGDGDYLSPEQIRSWAAGLF